MARAERKLEILPRVGSLVGATPESGSTSAGVAGAKLPTLVPALLLRRGHVCLPGEDGPVEAKRPPGVPFDPFDVVDRLAEQYRTIYLVDLDGIERGEPQLEYLQEFARDVRLWVDAGVRAADQAIDILITGARRVVLSTSELRGPRELKRAWKLSTEFAFEVPIDPVGRAIGSPEWGTTDPAELVRTAREVGVTDVVLSPRETDPNWDVIRPIAAGGPTWVDGTFQAAQLPRLAESGAAGGIFHITDLLAEWGREGE